jgi:hypothetical protein
LTLQFYSACGRKGKRGEDDRCAYPLSERWIPRLRQPISQNNGRDYNMMHLTGIEPESAKTTDEAEEPDVIDISKLKKIGE